MSIEPTTARLKFKSNALPIALLSYTIHFTTCVCSMPWLNTSYMENTIPTISRQSKIIAILKPGTDCDNYMPISLLYTYRLSTSNTEQNTIKQPGFRPGKSCRSQLRNLAQHIMDGYQEDMITGTSSVDVSAAYDTMNHRLLIQKLYNRTKDNTLCLVI